MLLLLLYLQSLHPTVFVWMSDLQKHIADTL